MSKTRNKAAINEDTGSAQAAQVAESDVDPKLLAAIQKVVKDEMSVVVKRLDDIDSTLAKLNGVFDRLDAIEKTTGELEAGLNDCTDRVEEIQTKSLPSIAEHIASVAEQLAHHTLKIDAHRRKWNVVVHGLEGPSKESEAETRKTCLEFAKNVLKVEDAEKTRMSACHRLSNKKDAGIIIRFTDLAQKDTWLAGTQHLKGTDVKVTLTPDLPPVIRPLKDQLMLLRSKMPQSVKTKTRLRHIPEWPFVMLCTEGQRPVKPDATLREITPAVLGISHVCAL